MNEYIIKTKNWVEKVVIGLNFCPFAKPVFVKNQIKFVCSEATTTDTLTDCLVKELLFLTDIEGDDVETTILVHPFVLQDFSDYVDYLEVANHILYQLDLEGTLQIASFHPAYQFEGTNKDDIDNYTNRSPYPMLHIIREDTVEKAIKTYPNIEDIPDNNIKKATAMGSAFFEEHLSDS